MQEEYYAQNNAFEALKKLDVVSIENEFLFTINFEINKLQNISLDIYQNDDIEKYNLSIYI